MNTNVVDLDIAKNIFHLYSLGADSKASKKKLKRSELLRYFANTPASLIGMEACGGAHIGQTLVYLLACQSNESTQREPIFA
jgi:transposase